jgi:hypothetical protein
VLHSPTKQDENDDNGDADEHLSPEMNIHVIHSFRLSVQRRGSMSPSEFVVS